MKSLKKILIMSAAFLGLSLTACGGHNSEEEVDENEVNVFVLSGQSNMEGNTSFKDNNEDLIAAAFTSMGYDDPQVCYDGIPEVQTSSYCAGYGQLNHNNLTKNNSVNATNKNNQIQGEFVDTKVGLGLNSSKFGPELGCAYGLRDHATAEKPIYFIKMASGGSGFEQSGTQYNWPVFDDDGNMPEINMYSTFAKPFIDNNLQNLVDQGLKPVIRGWLWHQGESDSATEKIKKYAKRLGDMVAQFRSDYAEYAKGGDGDNIAFVDGMIYQGANTSWGTQTSKDMNAAKSEFATSADNNYLVDIYGGQEAIAANELKPGSPGGDSMHYNAESEFKLGLGYAKIILDNNLLGE